MRFLTPIDVAQTDQAGNPPAGFGRVQFKTDGGAYSRTPAGVESKLGGDLDPRFSVVSTEVAVPAGTAPVDALTLTIPPGKTARIVVLLALRVTTTTPLTGNNGGGLQVTNPAGANGAVTGSIFTEGYPAADGTAAATAIKQGSVVSVAANTTTNFPTARSEILNALVVLPICVQATLKNNSTTTSAVVKPLTVDDSNGVLSVAIGSAIYGVIN